MQKVTSAVVLCVWDLASAIVIPAFLGILRHERLDIHCCAMCAKEGVRRTRSSRGSFPSEGKS